MKNCRGWCIDWRTALIFFTARAGRGWFEGYLVGAALTDSGFFMIVKKQSGLVVLTLLFLLWLSYLSLADEILFQDQKAPQFGTIVNEDEQGVTIRFSRESITSITRSQDRQPSAATPR